MDPRGLAFIKGVLGDDAAAALERAADGSAALGQVMVPRVALAWLDVAKRGFQGLVPGTEVGFELAKSERGYRGHLQVGGDRYEFREASIFQLAGAVAAAVTDAPIGDSGALARPDVVRLGRSIDLLAKAHVGKEERARRLERLSKGDVVKGPWDKAPPPQPAGSTPNELAPRAEENPVWGQPAKNPGQHSHKDYQCDGCGHVQSIGTNHEGPVYDRCPNCSWKGMKIGDSFQPPGYRVFRMVSPHGPMGKTEMPGQAHAATAPTAPAAPTPTAPRAQGAPKPTLPKVPKIPKPAGGAAAGAPQAPALGKTMKVAKSEAGTACGVCGQRQIERGAFVGCACFRELAGSVKVLSKGEHYVLQLGDGWGDAEAQTLAEALKIG